MNLKVLGAAASICLVLAGCGSQEGLETSVNAAGFPDSVKEAFLSNCQENAAAVSGLDKSEFASVCQCVLDGIETDFSLTEFEEAERDLIAGRDSRIDLESYASECS